MERRVPTKDEVLAYLKEDRNWGRWGQDDQVGAVNMVTPEKRVAAASLVKSGRAISLSREFPKTPAPNNPSPAIHYTQRTIRANGGGSPPDYYALSYHGTATTPLTPPCPVRGVGLHRDGEWPRPAGGENVRRRPVGVRRTLEGWNHHARRAPGRPQAPG